MPLYGKALVRRDDLPGNPLPTAYANKVTMRAWRDEMGMKDLVGELKDEFQTQLANLNLTNLSQHKDHAHKKLRHCLQHSSTNLAVLVALRLTEYVQISTGIDEISVGIKALVDKRISAEEVLKGLNHLARVGLLDWHGEEIVRITSVQLKHLARFYEEGE